MSQTQLISQLKFRVASLESVLSDRQHQLQSLKGIESQADAKIKALTKIHNDKTKSLLNSIQILKKEKSVVQGLGKEHKRSKLIEQLNKEILDQDIVIEVLRKYIYNDKGKGQGRKICDQIIVKALTKGPDRIRAVTREELRMEIEKLKLATNNKAKGGNQQDLHKNNDDGEMSVISEYSEKSFVNQNEEVFKKIRQLQNENEAIKLELATKGKIIQKLKYESKEKDRLKAQTQLLINQLQISARKVMTLEKLLRQTKENMHAKIGELYERELKVEELEMNSKQHGERLKQAHESTNLLLEEIRQEKEQLQIEYDMLKKQNQNLMLQKMSMKNRHDEQSKKIMEIRQINTKNKEQLGDKLGILQVEITKLGEENKRLTELLREQEMKYFRDKEEWVQEKTKLIDELAQGKTTQSANNVDVPEELDRLRKQNQDLKELLEGGGVGSTDSKVLLQRLQNYRMRLQVYESPDSASKERRIYDQLFQKYNNLLTQYQKLKKLVPASKLKSKRVNVVEVTTQEENQLKDISSGISNLGLEEIGSEILDNFDSSYSYELRIDEIDRQKYKGVPKLTEEDHQLLKLINSDLWNFVKQDPLQPKIDQALAVAQQEQSNLDQELTEKIRYIKNLSHPQGTKIVVFDSQLKDLEEISDSVSIASGVPKIIDQYDSDINIEVQRVKQGAPNLNYRQLGRVSDSISSGVDLSSAKSGQSSFVRRKKTEKATVIKVNKELSGIGSSMGSEMNSSVSSVNINESDLAEINSDVSVDFRKKKVKK